MDISRISQESTAARNYPACHKTPSAAPRLLQADTWLRTRGLPPVTFGRAEDLAPRLPAEGYELGSAVKVESHRVWLLPFGVKPVVVAVKFFDYR